jgi:hypothetical protein
MAPEIGGSGTVIGLTARGRELAREIAEAEGHE